MLRSVFKPCRRTAKPACKTVVETFQKTRKHRLQSANLLGVHVWASLSGQDDSFANLPKQGNVNLAL